MRDALVRRERLAHAMREVLSELLLTEVKDPRLAGVVISAVELSGDPKLARAFFSVFGDDERVRQVADGLTQARGFLRHESAKRLRMHNPPDLEFKRDLGFERADRVASGARRDRREAGYRAPGTAGTGESDRGLEARSRPRSPDEDGRTGMGERRGIAGAALARLKRRQAGADHLALARPTATPLGSELGVLLSSPGRSASRRTIVNRDPHPASLAFLPGLETLRVAAELPAGFERDFDLGVLLECPELDRPGLAGLDRLPLLNIDHHLEQRPATARSTSSTRRRRRWARWCWRWRRAPLAVPRRHRRPTSTPLSSPTPATSATPTRRRARSRPPPDWSRRGAAPHLIAEATLGARAGPRRPPDRRRARHSRAARRRPARRDRLRRARCCAARRPPEDTENLVNIPRGIDGVRVAVLLKAVVDGAVRVSLRSRGDRRRAIGGADVRRRRPPQRRRLHHPGQPRRGHARAARRALPTSWSPHDPLPDRASSSSTSPPDRPPTTSCRRRAGRSSERRIGHTGTLDPAATGLLLLCVGKATRLQQYLLAWREDLPRRDPPRLRERRPTTPRASRSPRRDRSPRSRERDRRTSRSASPASCEQLPPPYSAKKTGGAQVLRAGARRRGGPAASPSG